MSDASSISSDDAPRELVLCFDGTGNTFKADGTDSNILKIFRMLDRTKEDRCKLFCSIHVLSTLTNTIISLLLSAYASFPANQKIMTEYLTSKQPE